MTIISKLKMKFNNILNNLNGLTVFAIEQELSNNLYLKEDIHDIARNIIQTIALI